jgi:citrate synthase
MIINAIQKLCDTEGNEELINILFNAHMRAAKDNKSGSSIIVDFIGRAKTDFKDAIIAAMCTVGGLHAPITETRRFFFVNKTDVALVLTLGLKIPGFGNSFYKKSIDPSFKELAEYIEQKHSGQWSIIHDAKAKLWENGIRIYPNAAMLTAAVAEIINLPFGLEPLLFMLPRITTWAEIYKNARH